MKIVIANTQEFNPMIGGVERITAAYAKELQELGHEIFLVAVLKSKYSKPYIPVAKQLLLPDEIYDSKKNVELFSEFIMENDIQVIHNQAGNIEMFTRLCHQVSKATNCPLVSAVHIDPLCNLNSLKDFRTTPIYPKQTLKAVLRVIRYPILYWRVKRHTQKVYDYVTSHSDYTVLLSRSYEKPLLKILRNKNFRLISIPNWLPFKASEIGGQREKNILYVGRLDFEHKRVDRLITVWEKLYKKYPDWSLKIAGDGPLRNDLERYVQKKKIQRVEFLGFCEPNIIYKQSEILCLTSTIEGLSMVLIEGMANGCVPIVYGSFAAVYDAIQSGKSGFIVKPFSKKLYIRSLKKLMDNHELREKMRQEASHISQIFDKERIITQWLNLYTACIEERE